MLAGSVRTILAVLVAGCTLPFASAQTIHVDADLITGANDGTSWADAFQGADGLRLALASAGPGDELWVTKGTYRGLPSAPAAFRATTPGLTLRGGFLGGETTIHERPEPGGAPTVLSGDVLGNDDGTASSLADNSLTVLEVEDASPWTMERVTVTAALDNGFVARGADARVRLCSFTDCAGLGAFVSTLGSPPALRRAGNLVDCTFAGNAQGGLFYFGVPASPRPVAVDRCLFELNGGAGLRIGNVLPSGPSFPRPIVANSIARANAGPGLQITSQSDGANVEVNRCTLVSNGAAGLSYVGVCGLCARPEAFDCIVWDNAGPQLDAGAGPIVSGGLIQGPGSPDASAVFEDLAGGDLRLVAGSPAVDAGTAVPRSSAPVALDFARRPRVHDDPASPVTGGGAGVADAGALERSPFIGAIESTCPVAVNSSGSTGRTLATGSLEVQANDVTLIARGLPPGRFGIFLVSRTADVRPLAGGEGTLCLGGAVGRFVGPGQVLLSDASGSFSLDVDVTRLPGPNAPVAAAPGDTWRFQAWHRDGGPGGPTTNRTSTVAVTFG